MRTLPEAATCAAGIGGANNNSGNKIQNCCKHGYDCHINHLAYHEIFPAPSINDVLAMGFKRVFIGNEHNYHNGRNKNKKGRQEAPVIQFKNCAESLLKPQSMNATEASKLAYG